MFQDALEEFQPGYPHHQGFRLVPSPFSPSGADSAVDSPLASEMGTFGRSHAKRSQQLQVATTTTPANLNPNTLSTIYAIERSPDMCYPSPNGLPGVQGNHHSSLGYNPPSALSSNRSDSLDKLGATFDIGDKSRSSASLIQLRTFTDICEEDEDSDLPKETSGI